MVKFKVGDHVMMKPDHNGSTCGVPKDYMGIPGVIVSATHFGYSLEVPRQPVYYHGDCPYCPTVPSEMLELAEGPW